MIQVRPLGPQIGAEITGVDVRTLDDAGFGTIYRAWLDYNVVVVRDQDLTLPESYATAAASGSSSCTRRRARATRKRPKSLSSASTSSMPTAS